MEKRGVVRYAVEWTILSAVLLAVGMVVADRAGPAGSAGRVAGGILVVAFTELVVYLVVRRGLSKTPSRFFALWGASMVAKVAILGAAVLAVLGDAGPGRTAFLLGMAAVLPVMSVHQVIHLVRAAGPAGGGSPGGRAGGGGGR